MDLMVLGLIVLGFYLLVRLVATSSSWLSGRRFPAYRQLAALFRGKYESRGLTDPPTVSFTHNGSAVRVGLAPQVAGQSQAARTRVVARFSGGLPFRMELAPTARPAPSQAPKGTRLVRIGDPEFDRGYVVQANDPDMAREFLAPSVRRAIGNLHRLAPPAGMLVSINPERLLVQVDRNLGLHPEVLAGMVGESLTIHDGLRQGVAARMGQGIDDRRRRPLGGRGRRPAGLQGLRRPDPAIPGALRLVPDAPSPGLLGIHRGLLDLWVQRQAERHGLTAPRGEGDGFPGCMPSNDGRRSCHSNTQEPGPGFPPSRLVAVISPATGTVCRTRSSARPIEARPATCTACREVVTRDGGSWGVHSGGGAKASAWARRGPGASRKWNDWAIMATTNVASIMANSWPMHW